jgi:hypothetical protein
VFVYKIEKKKTKFESFSHCKFVVSSAID